MDPTASIPAHFTVEIVGVVAAGLVCAWSIFERRYASIAGAVSLGVAQALHAGAFLSNDDGIAIVVLRLAGVALIALGIFVRIPPRWEFAVGGVGGLAIGAAWSAVVGGSPVHLTLGPHLVGCAGAVVLVVWAWRVTRPYVRLRVLAAFVLALGMAVIVTGGSVARVAALEKRDEEFARLGPATVAVRRSIVDSGTALEARAAEVSPIVAPALSADRDIALPAAEDQTMVFDRSPALRKSVPAAPRYSAGSVSGRAAFSTALGGTVAGSFDVIPGALAITGYSPIFKPGGTRRAADVIGVVAITRIMDIGRLTDDAQRVAREANVAVVDRDVAVSSAPELSNVGVPRKSTAISLFTIDTTEGPWPATHVSLGGPDGAALILAVSDAHVVTATSDLVRTLLVALMASALLAVIISLWLSDRIARPMLDLAEEGERLKTDFLSSISHELRTPLTPIRGYTEILRKGRVPARRASGYLDEIGEAAQRLERIVTLLVDVAAIDAGRFHVEPVELDPKTLLTDAAARWRSSSRRHPIRVEVPDGLSSVKGDRVAIRRVIDEVIDNAIKFSPEGGAIELIANSVDGRVSIAVRDHGQGIDPERLEALGRAFEQEDVGDTRRYGGLGLGLTYVQGVLRAHGTRLVIESAPGDGTTCSFVLPAAGMVTRMPRKGGRPAVRKVSRR